MADPMTPERLAEIRSICVDPMTDELADEVERLRAELTEIRQHDETTGGVLYDVIRRTLTGDLDEHQAVRQIERRLIHPLAAQRRDAEARAARAAGRRRSAAVAQRDAVALAAETEWERHGEEIAEYEKTVAETIAERDEAREQVKRVEKLRDRWEAAVRDPTIYRNGGVEHAAALAASHLPDLRAALDGTEAGT